MRMQKAEIAFEAEGGAQPRLAGKSFLRSENDAGPVPRLAGVDREVSPAQTVRFMRARWGLFLAASLALHAGLLAAFQRKAPPLASVDVRPISVEIMRADKLSALAKKPSKTGSTINSVAAQEERQEPVKPEATRREEKVADVALSAFPMRAQVFVEAEPVAPVLPRHDQSVAAAEMVETKQVEAKIVEPESSISSVAAQEEQPVKPRTARAPVRTSESVRAEPVALSLPPHGHGVAAAEMVEPKRDEAKIAQPRTAEVAVSNTAVSTVNSVQPAHPAQSAKDLPATPAHSTDTAPLVATVPSAGTALPSVTATKPVAAAAKPPVVQAMQEVRPIHTTVPRVVMALPPDAPASNQGGPIPIPSRPPPPSASPAKPVLPPPLLSAPLAIPSLPAPTPASRPALSQPLPSLFAPALSPPSEAVTTAAAPLRPDAGDAVLTLTARPDSETLQASLRRQNPAGVAIEILPGAELRVGEKIALRVATKKPGYLIIMDIDATGKVTQIFPNRRSVLVAGQETANFIKPGRPVTVPEIGNPYAGFEFVAAPPTGIAMVLAILSDRPVQKLDLPDIPASMVGPTATVNYLTEWTHSARFARADAAAGPEEANWSFDAKLYAIH
jgi:hypothetical protein